MRAPRLFRTLAFRIVFVYIAIFAVSAAGLVAFTYWNTKRELDSQTDQTIDAEIVGLSEQYQRLGLGGLADVIMSRSVRGSQGLYLLTDAQHHPISGNLDGWPDFFEEAVELGAPAFAGLPGAGFLVVDTSLRILLPIGLKFFDQATNP